MNSAQPKSRVTRAVFPVAGLGTRFLPATKATPKEMLPVVDKPLIQYATEEAVAAGIDTLIFVTGRSKRAIEDHFDKSVELEIELEARGKQALLELVGHILPSGVTCIYTRQAEALGLGHAVLCARAAVGDEPFAVLLPDDLIVNQGAGATAQLIADYERTGASVVAVEPVDPDKTDKYGIVSVEDSDDRSSRLRAIVEKPAPSEAPSNLGVVGRYVLKPEIFPALERTRRGAGNEIQLTDAIAKLVADDKVHALRFEGTRFDCGSKLGFLQASVELGVRHPQVGAQFSEYLANR
ncbi:MAG: UTP--glucose-1-phosphate uridylyltransferase GalU [Gammaproteobacteria bacterium]